MSNFPKPIITCTASTCGGCNLSGVINCHFCLSGYVKFIISSLPGFLLGALGITRLNNGFLFPWIIFCIFFFGIIETRILCSHCPHYGEPGVFLRCFAARGLLKLWKWRPGPLSVIEKFILLFGFGLIWLFPVPFLVIRNQWILFSAYGVAVIAFFVILKWQFCRHCFNFGCPLNGVSENVKQIFLRQNPFIDAR